MSSDQRIDRLLEKAQRLRQSNETWEAASRLGRTWITPRNTPAYRPYLILVTNTAGAILRSQVMEKSPTSDHMFEELLNAMLHPSLGSGRSRRPKVMNLDAPEYVSALTPRLADLEVSCQHRLSLPSVKNALASLERSMNRGEPIPGLLTLPSVTPPLVGHLFALAADFYRATPWRWLNDNHSMEIRYPLDGVSRYAVVMGSGGEVFGLAVYDTLDDLRLIFESHLSPRQMTRKASWLVLFFEEAMAMSFDDLDAMTTYGWSVPSERAYPVFGRTTKTSELGLPTQADLVWMEAALAGILAYLPEHKHNVLQPTERTFTITTIRGKTQLHLKLPAFEREW